MALTTRQQRLYQRLKSAMPSWAFATATGEVWESIAVVFDTVREQMRSWVNATYILRAQGSWLDVHANERGTQRKLGESDPSLRDRMRTVEDAVTGPAIEAAADAILAANGCPTGAATLSLGARTFAHKAADASVEWSQLKGVGQRTNKVFASRGYRVTTTPTSSEPFAPYTGVVILPYGTTPTATLAVTDMVRIKGALGFKIIVETRSVP